MKKFIALAAVMSLGLTLILSGCSIGTTDRDSELKSTLKETKSELNSTFSESTTKFSMVEEYLNSWTKNNNIDITANSEHYMVLTNNATQNGKDSDSFGMVCSVDPDNIKDSKDTLATGMTALLGPEEHSKISLIILETNTDNFDGAISIDSKYLNVDHLVSLESGSDNDLTTSGAYSFDAVMSGKLKYQSPTYNNAYEISLTLSDYKDSFDFDNKYPNAIKVLGNYLASCKSSGKLFQIASISCKTSDSKTPYSAKAIVVVDDNNIESIQTKFESSRESIQKKCDKLDIDFVYTMDSVSLPNKVIKDSSSSKIINLIYTIDSGIYSQDEKTGEVISADDIYNISTKEGKFNLKINARSKTTDSLNELKQTLKTTAGLSDAKYSTSDNYSTWQSQKDLSSYFKNLLTIDDDSENLTTLKTSNLSILSNKNSDLDCVQYTVADDGEEVAMLNCVHYISHLLGDDSDTN